MYLGLLESFTWPDAFAMSMPIIALVFIVFIVVRKNKK